MDTRSPLQRSELMSRVRGKDTKPEVAVRRLVHRMGYRFRLHASLPGRPDLVFPRLRKVIFVHGCFWHRHNRCRKASTPANHREFWQDKFRANKRRDKRSYRLLESAGWKVVVVWECELKNLNVLKDRLSIEMESE